jgi:hypothetical protein
MLTQLLQPIWQTFKAVSVTNTKYEQSPVGTSVVAMQTTWIKRQLARSVSAIIVVDFLPVCNRHIALLPRCIPQCYWDSFTSALGMWESVGGNE